MSRAVVRFQVAHISKEPAMLIRTTLCLTLIAAVAAAAADEPTDSEVKIRLLRQERVAVLTELRDTVVGLHEIGAAGATFEQVYRAERALLRARLELAGTRQERIQLHEDLLAKTAKWLASVTALNQNGAVGGSNVDLLRAKAHVLATQVALEQARSAK
jgi:hypothetical protein